MLVGLCKDVVVYETLMEHENLRCLLAVGYGLLNCRSLKPPLPGFVGHAGECRDKDGGYGTRLEHNGAINLDDCGAMCVKQVTNSATQF